MKISLTHSYITIIYLISKSSQYAILQYDGNIPDLPPYIYEKQNIYASNHNISHKIIDSRFFFKYYSLTKDFTHTHRISTGNNRAIFLSMIKVPSILDLFSQSNPLFDHFLCIFSIYVTNI